MYLNANKSLRLFCLTTKNQAEAIATMNIIVMKRARITSPALLPPLDPGAALEELYHKNYLALKFKNELYSNRLCFTKMIHTIDGQS